MISLWECLFKANNWITLLYSGGRQECTGTIGHTGNLEEKERGINTLSGRYLVGYITRF